MDASMFAEKSTYIPEWVIDDLWGIREIFIHASKNNIQSEVDITYNNPGGKTTHHEGWVTTTKYHGKRNDVMRFYFDNDVKSLLKRDFEMTYKRMKEKNRRDWNSPKAEREIPFWEFIDIEFDDEEYTFILTPHYNLPQSMIDRFPEINCSDFDNPHPGSDYSAPEKTSAWMVLQNPVSNYEDKESECYEYPRSIPNGVRIAAGDYLICTLSKKNSEGGKRIIGIGKIDYVQEFIKNNRNMRKAYYEWYLYFKYPKTFDFIGGDPRNNLNNAINSIPEEQVRGILKILAGDLIVENLP